MTARGRVVLATLAVLFVLGAGVLAGCTDAPEPVSGNDDGVDAITVCQITDSRGADDDGLNAATSQGLDEISKTLGARKILAESTRKGDYEDNLTSLLAQGCDLLVASGADTAESLQPALSANPGTDFALVGGTFTGADGKPTTPRNGRSIQFQTGPAGYLAGYLAAGASQSGVVAVLGGTPSSATKLVMDGFVDGVAAYNAENQKKVSVLGWDKTAQSGEFAGTDTDQTRGYSAASRLLGQKADVLLPVGGPFALGALDAVAATDGARAIWVGARPADLPAHADLVLAGISTDVESELLKSAKEVTDGDFDNASYLGTLKNGGVEFVLSDDEKQSIPTALTDQLDDKTAAIKDGSLVVASQNAPAS